VVFSFDDQPRLLLAQTTDTDAVERTVRELHPSGRYTTLYDALYDASRYLRDARTPRKAIVLLTDGRDENSALSIEDALKVAQEAHIPVFCVGVGRIEERVLRRIAKLTSGNYAALQEAASATLAGQIEALVPVVATPAPSVGTPPPPTTIAPPDRNAAPPAHRLSWLAAAAALAGLVLLLVVLLVRSSRAKREGTPATERAAELAARTELRPRPPETIMARMDLGEDTVERTVFLQEKASLAITAGPGRGKVYPLSATSATSVGRARANDVVLEDETVSAQHFRIRPEDGRFALHDLGSTNGTKVNDRRVSRHPLSDGDVVRVGDTSLEFRLTRRT
jgi:hypothetical protein